jgi:serine/threonine protein kinase/tetratricopeptide (TPR) repeat protein
MTTAPEQWQEVKRVLAAALDLDPSERSNYLDRTCTSPSLRREVDSLIAANAVTEANILTSSLEGGVKLGSYTIVGPIAAGGMGVVYKARDTKLPRNVALKILPPSYPRDSAALERFRREAKVLASLSHPNIVTIYEIGTEGDTLYIAMEFVDGRVLSDVLAVGRMRMEEILDVAGQVSSGLAFAHRSGIVHRDLKPKNVMIRRDGIVKILDFGLSKLASGASQSLMEQSTELTRPATLIGTVDYMSPQQAAGLPVDYRSDQFSFGVMVYEMVTGKRPFARGTAAQTLAAIIEDDPLPAASLNRKVPFALDSAIRRCLKKNPDERYASTEDLAHDLSQKREEVSVSGRSQLPRWAIVATLALLVSLVGLGIWTIAPRFSQRVPGVPMLVNFTAAEQVAVLPFTNVGNDASTQAFCDGLMEILTSKLSQLEQFHKSLRVVPASDVLQQGVVSAQEARQTFGVNLVITGSIQRIQDQVRMTINLVDPRAVRQLKSATIDTKVQDISTLQDGVVLETAELLGVPLTDQARQVLAIGGTTVPDAYDLYAQGVGYLQRYDVPENVDHAISLFKSALAEDKQYALAQAELGEAYWRKYEQTKDPKWVAEAKESSAAALKLNDNLAQVYVTLGMIRTGTGEYPQAVDSLHRALQIDPLNADAYRELAQAYEKLGNVQAAESTYQDAISVRPSYWGGHARLGFFYFSQGRYADAEKQFQTVVQLTPDNAAGYGYLGMAALAQKRYEDAAKMFERSLAIKPSDAVYNYLGILYFTQGKYLEAARYFESAVKMNAHNADRWHSLATAYEWSNQPEKAYAAFQKTAELAETQLHTNPRDTGTMLMLADADSMLHQDEPAKQLVQKALALDPDDLSDIFQASVIYEQVGDRKLALRYLGQAIKGGYPRDVIDNAPSLAKLRRDPRYKSLFGP